MTTGLGGRPQLDKNENTHLEDRSGPVAKPWHGHIGRLIDSGVSLVHLSRRSAPVSYGETTLALVQAT